MRQATLAMLVAMMAPAAPPPPVYWPTAGRWVTVNAVETGADPAVLDAALLFAGERNSTAVVVLHHGRIVAERYWKGWNEHTAEPIFSASKSIASTLAGMAIDDGKIKGVAQGMADFVPSWKGTPKAVITVRHMLSMTSGLKNSPGTPGAGEEDAFAATAALPLEHAPGERWEYNTPAYRMVLRIIEIATGESLEDYTRRRLTGPLGMKDSSWDGRPAAGGSTNWHWFRASARDMARFGLLALRRGEWAGKQLVSADWLRDATAPSQKLNPAYGFLWWVNGRGAGGRLRFPDAPADTFAALGAMDKKIYVVPSLDLVVVRHGPAAGLERSEAISSFDNQFLGRVCQAFAPAALR